MLEQQEVGVGLTAAFNKGIVKGEAQAEVKNLYVKAVGGCENHIYICQSGGSGDRLEVTIDELVEQAANFPKVVEESPVIITAIINDYPSSVGNIPTMPPKGYLALLSDQTKDLEKLGDAFLKLEELKEDLTFALNHFDQFVEVKSLTQDERNKKKKDLQDYLNQIPDEIEKVQDQASLCVDDYDTYKKNRYSFPENLRSLSLPGGTIMTFKELEEKLAQLTTEVEHLKQNVILKEQPITIRSFSGKYLNTNDDSKDKLVPANYIIKEKNDPGQYEIMKIYRY